MIVVLGWPTFIPPDAAGGPAVLVAVELARLGQPVELVGSVGDDDAGDAVAVALARAGVGHAALLRDPSGRTPGSTAGPLPRPRLDARDVELGLSYLVDYRLLIVAEALPDDVLAVAGEAARYHGAELVALDPVPAEPDEIRRVAQRISGARQR